MAEATRSTWSNAIPDLTARNAVIFGHFEGAEMQNEQEKMQLNVSMQKDIAVIKVFGSAGMSEAHKLLEKLEELTISKVPVIILDLTGMDFICSLGLGAIISGHLKSRHHKGVIKLVNPQHSVLELLETTRLTKLFPVYNTIEQAMAV